MVMSCLQTVSPYKYQQVNVHYQTLSVRVPSSKACLSCEGVAVDKIKKVWMLHSIHGTGCFMLTDLPTF